MKGMNRLAAAVLALMLIRNVGAEDLLERFRAFAGIGGEEEKLPSEDITPKRGKNSPLPENKPEGKEAAPTAVSSSPAMNWYCRHMKDGARPPIPPEMGELEQYGGCYLGADEKVIYLTFDAGYENGNVEKILDVLKAEQVPGAFFILENLVLRNTELVKRMIAEGHTVCNHTARHKDMTAMTSKEEFAKELEAMERVYQETMGAELAKYYRPPEGRFNTDNLKWAQELGYRTILWSFAYADWDNNSQMSPEKAKAKVLAGTHNGEVLLLHPTSATNAAILGELIRSWKNMGYRFGTLDELTGGTANP